MSQFYYLKFVISQNIPHIAEENEEKFSDSTVTNKLKQFFL